MFSSFDCGWEQLLLVLAQQGGPLSALAKESAAPMINGGPTSLPPRGPLAPADDDSVLSEGAEPIRRSEVEAAAPDLVGASTSSAVPAQATTGRRRRR